jgi:hypothetical protein
VPFKVSLPGISKHLKVLERAGLMVRGGEAQWQPCWLRAGPLKDVADWLEHDRRFRDESCGRLAEYPNELPSREKSNEHKE